LPNGPAASILRNRATGREGLTDDRRTSWKTRFQNLAKV
jgi:hypothetical protein